MPRRRPHGRLPGRDRPTDCMQYEGGIGRWTLRFQSAGLETGFMLSRRQRLTEWTSIMMVWLVILCSGISLAQNFWNVDQYPTDAAMRSRKWQASTQNSGFVFVDIRAYVARARSRVQYSRGPEEGTLFVGEGLRVP
ncbi:unnamed protein product [Prorocentrum cordatum]|uniref:Uncharacterized protein n=1 Tax=Prorocentrum cordatum TaxID=2364126 RepID=A0ABN9PWY9_9DINO|nr:unnamed protein product [Polarella glacialis]